MKFLLFFLIMLLTVFSCIDKSSLKKNILHNNHKQLVADSTIYGFLNSILTSTKNNEDSRNAKYITDKGFLDFKFSSGDSLMLTKMDTLLSKKDIKFIYEQLKNSNTLHLNPKLLKTKMVFIPGDTIIPSAKVANRSDIFWENYLKLCNRKGLMIVSYPLFSKNHSVAIISLSETSGPTWGSGGTFIYHRIKGQWILVWTLNSWIS